MVAIQTKKNKLKKIITYRDKKSVFLIDRNGDKFNSKMTNHIKIRYFCITKHINKYEIEVNYCPNEDIIMYYFTKHFQFKMLIKFRKSIMNLKD